MKYCVNCGKEMLEDASFCHSCGHKVQPEILVEEKNVIYYEKEHDTKALMSMILGIASVYFCLFPLGIVAVCFANKAVYTKKKAFAAVGKVTGIIGIITGIITALVILIYIIIYVIIIAYAVSFQ